MKDLQSFDKLTVREILIAYIGEEKTDILLKTILQGIKNGLEGEALDKLICETLCKLSVNKTEVYFFLQIIPHVNPK